MKYDVLRFIYSYTHAVHDQMINQIHQLVTLVNLVVNSKSDFYYKMEPIGNLKCEEINYLSESYGTGRRVLDIQERRSRGSENQPTT